MTAAPVTIVCANCGAKYKLPADFKAASAKCKGCGASIDVAGQLRAAAAKPAAKEPARSRPQPAATVAATAGSTRGRSAARAGRDRKTADAGARGREASPRRGRTRGDAAGKTSSEGKGNKVVLIGSLVAIVALAVVGYFVMFGGKGTEGTPPTTASAPPEAGKNAPGAAPQKSEVVDASSEADAMAKQLAMGSDAKTEDDPKVDDKTATAALEGEKPAAKKPAKKAKPEANETKSTLTAADVFDPRTLEPLQYPDYVDEAQRKEIDSLCEDLRNGGITGRRAKAKLEEIGHAAIVGVVNEYQKVDFKNPDQAMYAFELNKFLTSAFGAGVISADYKMTQAGEPIPLETADWNAKTVNAWRRFWEKNSDKEVWEKLVKDRKEGKGAKTEGGDKEKDGDK